MDTCCCVTQKLLYLYGFPEIDVTEKGKKFDTETLNILTLCLGVMYGVAGANNALKAVAKALGTGVQNTDEKSINKGDNLSDCKKYSKVVRSEDDKRSLYRFF